MRLSRLAGSIAAIVSVGLPARGQQALPFLTDFETNDAPGFVAGNLHGQGGGHWTVSQGPVVVQTDVCCRGAQAVSCSGTSAFQVALGHTNAPVWVDVFFQGPAPGALPDLPTGALGAVVAVLTGGVFALHGDGQGEGVYTNVFGPISPGQFVRVSLRLDFSNAAYEVWIDGACAATNLGFLSTNCTSLHGVRWFSRGPGVLDSFSATLVGLAEDADGDLASDLDEVKLIGTSPSDPDSDDDAMPDGHEVIAGTGPLDSNSCFALTIHPATNSVRIAFDSITGRTYNVESVGGLTTDLVWCDVPGMTHIPGDGSVKEFTYTNAAAGGFFRARVGRATP